MKFQSNNNFHYVVCAFLILLILCGLVVLNSYLIAKKASSALGYDYSIVHGRDFANGQLVITKMLNDDKTVVWTKDDGSMDAFSSSFTLTYTQYKLHHDKPLIDYLWRTAYIKNPFICIVVPSHTKWWHFEFKEWKCYFFKDVQGYPKTPPLGIVYHMTTQFLNYLENNDLPIDEVQKAYKEIVRLFDDKEKCAAFIDDFIDSHEKIKIITMVADAAKTGSLPPGDIEWDPIARIILKHRDDFPDDLPDIIMEKLLDVWQLPDAQEDTSFMLNNYLFRPTEYNALHVFLEVMGYLQKKNNAENAIEKTEEETREAMFDGVFDILHKHNLLEKSLTQVYSDDVETPPLPAPAAIPPDYSGYRLINIYYTDTYDDIPEREKLLKISCFPDVFKTYWQERLKRLQEKQKEK